MIPLKALDADFYLLPEDGTAAHERFLALLLQPGETWISAYGFTDDALLDEIAKADAAGVPVHLLLDRSQAAGHIEAPKLKRLAAKLKHGDVTITTAGIGSSAPGQIWHDKLLVTRATDGGEDHVWWGSVNFSQSGWQQGNCASVFRSSVFASVLIHRFLVHAQWARAQEAASQISPAPLTN